MNRNLIVFLAVLYAITVSAGGNSPIEKGNSLYFEGRFSEALRFYSQALTESIFLEDTPRVMFYSALCYLNMGNPDMALKAFWQIVGDYPRSELADNAYIELAKLREKQGNDHLGEALVLYETVISRYPQSEKQVEAFLGAARVKVALNYQEYAHQTMQNVIGKFGSFEETAQIHYDIALIYANSQNPQRNPRKALEHLDIITSRFWGSDQVADSILLKAKLQWELGNRAESLQLYREITLIQPGSPIAEYAQESIAKLYEEQGDLQRAVNAYRILQIKYSFSDLTRQRLQAQIDRFTKPDSTRDKPTISAWNAREDNSSKLSYYEGDVEVALEKTVIYADRAEVDYSANRILASENVRLRWNDKYLIYCDKVVWKIAEKEVLCEGHVLVKVKNPKDVSSKTYKKIRLSISDGKISEEGM